MPEEDRAATTAALATSRRPRQAEVWPLNRQRRRGVSSRQSGSPTSAHLASVSSYLVEFMYALPGHNQRRHRGNREEEG
jgi:hypothetical protein